MRRILARAVLVRPLRHVAVRLVEEKMRAFDRCGAIGSRDRVGRAVANHARDAVEVAAT